MQAARAGAAIEEFVSALEALWGLKRAGWGQGSPAGH